MWRAFHQWNNQRKAMKNRKAKQVLYRQQVAYRMARADSHLHQPDRS